MEQSFEWGEPGREQLKIRLQVEAGRILEARVSAVGCLDFLRLSQKMKERLKGPLQDVLVPSGNDHASMIWREMVLQMQKEWNLPVTYDELCHCRKVLTQTVDRAIVYGAHTLSDVRNRTSANTGCGTCKPEVLSLIKYRLKAE